MLHAIRARSMRTCMLLYFGSETDMDRGGLAFG
jgi:hypothetical protein